MTNPTTRRVPGDVNTALRRGVEILAGTAAALVTLVGLAIAGAVTTSRSTHQTPPVVEAGSASAAQAEVSAAGTSTRGGQVGEGADDKLVVAFVAGATGTTTSDLLAPYDIFASSQAFSTYVVAASASPAMMVGGPALVPTYTFDAVDAAPELTPDLVVVPALEDPAGPREADLRAWVTRQHDRGARVLGVCAGARVLAATGMLDGRTATSHWSRIGALEKTNPDVTWVRGRVYVDDGDITTTGAVTSGVPAALHLMARLVGNDEAQRVADLHPELQWTPTVSPVVDDAHFALSDWPVALHWVEPWLRPTIGVVLHDGVSELDATAVFEVWSQSAAAHTIPIADDVTVTTQHGLVLLTTAAGDAPSLSRRIIPGGGFTTALGDLATHAGTATAASTAKMLGYPTPTTDAARPVPIRLMILTPLGLGLAVLAGVMAVRLLRTFHRSARGDDVIRSGRLGNQNV